MIANLHRLLSNTETLKKEIKSSKWDENDVRLAFDELFYDSYYAFYLGHAQIFIGHQFRHGRIRVDSVLKPMKDHLDRLVEYSTNDYLAGGQMANMNREFLYSVWTGFELVVSVLFKELIGEEGNERIFTKMNDRLLKYLNKEEDEVKRETLINDLRKKTFIPLERKFNALMKIDEEGSSKRRDLDSDKKLLKLLNRLRNCMIHSNGLYLGSSDVIEMFGVKFIFNSGEILIMEGKVEDKASVVEKLLIELRAVFKSLEMNTTGKSFIPYPQDEL